MAETPPRVPAFRRFWTARLVSTGGDQVARTALLISGIGVLATLALVAPALSRAEHPASRTTRAGTRDARV